MKRFIRISISIISICCILLTVCKISYAYEKNTKSNSEVSVTNALKEERNIGMVILKASGISFIISTVVCAIIVSKHKPVKAAKTANNYLNENRASITKRDDIFISSTIDKQLR